MKWALPLFLFGFLFALLIFGFNTPLLQNFQINYSLPTTWPDLLTAIGTILTAIVAISFGVWGKTLNEMFYKPDILLIGYLENLQNNRSDTIQGHTRLKFINKGGSVAENVMVYINEVTEGGYPRPNFLPVPLSWTHDGRYMRNFASKEVWYLDLCRKDNINDYITKPILVLAAGQGVPNYEDINEGETILKIRLSHKSGQIRNYEVKLTWENRKNYVKVKSFSEV